MLSVNHIASFLNEIFLQSKLSKSSVRTLKIYTISRRKRWNQLIFCMVIQIHANQKVIENFREWV